MNDLYPNIALTFTPRFAGSEGQAEVAPATTFTTRYRGVRYGLVVTGKLTGGRRAAAETQLDGTVRAAMAELELGRLAVNAQLRATVRIHRDLLAEFD